MAVARYIDHSYHLFLHLHHSTRRQHPYHKHLGLFFKCNLHFCLIHLHDHAFAEFFMGNNHTYLNLLYQFNTAT